MSESPDIFMMCRYVLEALLSRPGPGSSGKMFRFGMIALKQFKSRLSEWPQYCSHIVHIPHIVSDYADVAADVEAAMRSGMQFTQSGGGGHVGNSGDVEDATLSSLLPQPSQKQPQPPQQPEQSSMTTLSMPSVPNTSSSPPALTAPDIDAIMMDHSHGMVTMYIVYVASDFLYCSVADMCSTTFCVVLKRTNS